MTDAPTCTVTLTPTGKFSLEESARFGFGQRHAQSYDGVMTLAFCLDRTWAPVGVELRPAGDAVDVRAWGSADTDAIARQVGRVLSLDHDATTYDRLGDADPVVAGLQAVAPGLRPPLFHSPYEAAAWAVLSARRPARQMAEVRRALSLAHGTSFTLAGRVEPSLPGPEALLAVRSIPGLTDQKVQRLHGVARAALDGSLDVDHLVALGPDAAQVEVQKLAGIGPFYASLIAIRACGFTDTLPTSEPRLLAAVASAYGLDGPPDPATFARIAEPWRPWRTWVSVLFRAASGRLPL